MTQEEAWLKLIMARDPVNGRFSHLVPIHDGLGGNFSLTFRAFDLKERQPIVLKFLRPNISLSDYRGRSFEREIEIGRQLSGREGIIQLRAGPETLSTTLKDEKTGIVVPFDFRFYGLELARDNFASYVGRANEPSLRRRLEVVRSVAKGLRRLHSLGYCHRDLKPENILLVPGGEAKLGDLGTCRLLDKDDPPLADYVGPAGAFTYAAPEMILGGWNDRALYCGADWFGVGAILFEAVTGANLYVAIGLHAANLRLMIQKLALLDINSRAQIFLGLVENMAGSYAVPSVSGIHTGSGVLASASPNTVAAVDRLVSGLCHFDFRERMTSYNRILPAIDIAIGHAAADERRYAAAALRGKIR